MPAFRREQQGQHLTLEATRAVASSSDSRIPRAIFVPSLSNQLQSSTYDVRDLRRATSAALAEPKQDCVALPFVLTAFPTTCCRPSSGRSDEHNMSGAVRASLHYCKF